MRLPALNRRHTYNKGHNDTGFRRYKPYVRPSIPGKNGPLPVVHVVPKGLVTVLAEPVDVVVVQEGRDLQQLGIKRHAGQARVEAAI